MTKQKDVRYGWEIHETLVVGLREAREEGEGWLLRRR